MDALSALLEEVHLHGANYYYLHGHGDWSFQLTSPDDVMVFYVVLSGKFHINIDGHDVVAGAGDMLMLPQSMANHCASKPLDEANLPDEELIHALPLDNNQPVQIGNGFMTTQAIMVLCEYDHDMAKPLLNALPPILPEPKSAPKDTPSPALGFSPTFSSTHFDIHSEVVKIGLAYLSLEARSERMGKTTMINRFISMMMVECLREYIEGLNKESDNWLLALTDANLAKAIGVMHAKPEENWSINSLAEISGMSRSSFAERFKQVVGEPPLTYLTSYRLRLAARFLRLEQYSIGRISELVGYASDSTFSQAFKREYGLSPMQYRQKFIRDTGDDR